MEEYQGDKLVSGASGLAKAPLANPKQTANAGNKPKAQASGQKPGPKRARWWVALAAAVTLLIPMLHKELGEDPGPEPTVTSAAFAKSHGKEVKTVRVAKAKKAAKAKQAVAKRASPQKGVSPERMAAYAVEAENLSRGYWVEAVEEAAKTPTQKAEDDVAGAYAQMRAAAMANQSVEAFRGAREKNGSPPMNYEALKQAQTEATILNAQAYQAAVAEEDSKAPQTRAQKEAAKIKAAEDAVAATLQARMQDASQKHFNEIAGKVKTGGTQAVPLDEMIQTQKDAKLVVETRKSLNAYWEAAIAQNPSSDTKGAQQTTPKGRRIVPRAGPGGR